MTENLAARGEELAGLRERIVAAMKRAWPKTKVRSYNGVILELEKLCREIALEAAPAGTAPDVLREIAHIAGAPATPSPQAPPTLKQLEEIMLDLKKRGFDHLNVGSCSLMELHKQLFEQCNAFSTTSAREQSPATAANNPSTGDMRAILDHCWRIIEETQQDTGRFGAIRGSARKIMSFGLPGNNPLRIVEVTPLTEDTKLWLNGKKVPAATQEQERPAGSEASEQRIQELAMVLAKRVLRVTRVDITSADSEEKARELLTLLVGPQSGSPRKVGEDGALTEERAKMIAACLVRGCIVKLGHERTREGVIDEIASTLLTLARSSSVPVGEQKESERGTK